MARKDGQDVLIVIHRRLKGSGLILTYQRSGDLSGWTDIAADIEVLNPDIDGDGRTELVRASHPRGLDEARGFLRLRIAMP